MSDMKGRTIQLELEEICKQSENQSVHNLPPDHFHWKLVLTVCISLVLTVCIGLGIGISISLETSPPPDESGIQELPAHSTQQSTVGNFKESSATVIGCPDEVDLVADNLLLNETLENCTVSMTEQSKKVNDCEEDRTAKFLEQEIKIKDFKDLAEKENAQLQASLNKKELDYNKTLNILETLKRERNTAMTLSHTFRNISRLTENGIKSDPQYMRGILWQMWVSRERDKYLGIFLLCKPNIPSNGWSYRAKYKVTLCVNGAAEDGLFREVDHHTYLNDDQGWGNLNYVTWTELVAKYVQDDSITVKMDIWTEYPQGV